MRPLRRLPPLPARRQVLAVVAVVAHLFAATGAPVPSPRGAAAGKSSVAYPCSDHACGCLTAVQCWAGDCCCFTLEQKLAWADARGVSPPEHVRPEVEARKARNHAKPKKLCCSSEHEACEIPAAKTCCEKDDEPAPTDDSSLSVRWVSGAFHQKCRGQTPAGLLELDPAVPPTLNAGRPAKPEPERFARVPAPAPVFTCEVPPTPPPRLG